MAGSEGFERHESRCNKPQLDHVVFHVRSRRERVGFRPTSICGLRYATVLSHAGCSILTFFRLASGELGPDHAKVPVTHNSSEIGDTVGDPLKDSSGSMLNIVMKLNAMCGVVVDVFAGAFRRQCDNHGNLLAVHDIAETWKLSTATGILKVLPLDFLSNIIPVVRLHITFLFTYLCVAAVPSSLGSVKEVDIPKHVLSLKRT